MAPRFVDDLRNVVLRMAVPMDELPVSLRLFKRIEVEPLDILDQGQLGRCQVIDIADDRGN